MVVRIFVGYTCTLYVLLICLNLLLASKQTYSIVLYIRMWQSLTGRKHYSTVGGLIRLVALLKSLQISVSLYE